MSRLLLACVFVVVAFFALPAAAQNNLVVTGSTTLGGTQTYDNVTIASGGTLHVADYNGNASTTGTLHLIVNNTFTIDAGGTVNGDSRGYRGQGNANGEGPGGGQGGSCCLDGGGGGAYGGGGGRGTRDNGSLSGGVGGNAYGSSTSLAIQMGSAGGAAGSADGDSGGTGPDGGGAFRVTAATIVVHGTITMNGGNGSTPNNDATGGGAGGGILLDGGSVTIGGGAVLRANGGAGGNTDDDGGGGGGGRIKVFYGAGTPTGGTQQVSGGNGPGPATNGGSGSITTTQTNIPPTAVAGGGYSGLEGGAVTMGGAGSTDSDGTVVLYEWDCTDDGTYDTSTATPGGVCSYAQDGSYVARLRVTDDGGLTDDDSASVTVGNVAPVAAAGGPYSADEGSPVAFSGSETDAGVLDSHTAAWDFGDSTSGTGFAPSHAYADDGTFTATITVTDDAGGSGSATATVSIANVAPTITSTAPTSASEGAPFAYAATMTDPGSADTHTWTLPFAPAGMTVDATGGVAWTPTFADVGTTSVVLQVEDDDGGSDVQSFTLAVGFLDADNDGMADGWETDHGLDPTDPTDAAGDPDADGLTNLDEFLGGTDPNLFDGPGAPPLIDPIGGVEVADARPDLVVGAAVDPQNDALTYDVEVYEDGGLTVLLTSVVNLPADGTGGVTWPLDVPVDENAEAHWRARASDPFTAGPWSAAETFFVNEVEEAPEVPTPIFPIDGERVATTLPTPQWSDVADPDGDDVTYEVRIFDALEQLVTEGAVDPNGAREEWTVDVELSEDAGYTWDVRALDDTGLTSDWSDLEPFFVTADEGAPGDVVFVSPEDGETVRTTAPELVATETTDPEGDAITYVFGLDTAADFASEDFLEGTVAHAGTGTTVWDLSADGVDLTPNTTWHARVRAEDSTGLGSVGGWDVISFFVAGDDDAPPVPELISPEDGATLTDGVVVLEIGTVEDLDGDSVTYRLRVSADEAGEDVLAEVGGLVAEDLDRASWTPSVSLRGTMYWTARAEAGGATSDWATPFRLTVDLSDPVAIDDDGLVTGGGCENCEASTARGSGTGGALLLGLLIGLRRRRA